jgi:hypothetical protein
MEFGGTRSIGFTTDKGMIFQTLKMKMGDPDRGHPFYRKTQAPDNENVGALCMFFNC